jgi:hypothetical protein
MPENVVERKQMKDRKIVAAGLARALLSEIKCFVRGQNSEF